jgi:hypothetical protein
VQQWDEEDFLSKKGHLIFAHTLMVGCEEFKRHCIADSPLLLSEFLKNPC